MEKEKKEEVDARDAAEECVYDVSMGNATLSVFCAEREKSGEHCCPGEIKLRFSYFGPSFHTKECIATRVSK
jgi:hypothetical protein